MQEPLISIIVPIYNSAGYLDKCLASLMKQTYKEIEVLMINDGSTDSSEEICKKYADIDRRFILYSQENRGRSVARNQGLNLAQGQLIGFVDSDDWVEEDMFEFMLHTYSLWNADIVQCSYFYHTKESMKDMSSGYGCLLDKKQALEILFADKYIKNFLWNKLFSRSLFEGIVFPENKNFEDVYVLYRIFARAKTVVCLKESKYHYRVSPTSISHASFNVADKFEYLDAINEQYLLAHSVGIWKKSSVFLTRRYMSILDQCIVHNVDPNYIVLLSKYLTENIKGTILIKEDPYLALRRFLFLRVRKLYFMLVRH